MKFIRKEIDYKIFENYKKAKELIEKEMVNVSGLVNNSDNVSVVDGYEEKYRSELEGALKILRDDLKKNPNLLYTFMLFLNQKSDYILGTIPTLMGDSNDITDIRGMIKWVKNNKASVKFLPKPLIEYDEFENLVDDVKRVEENKKSKKFEEVLKYVGYTNVDIEEYDKDNINDNIGYISKKFGELSKKEQKQLTEKLKHYKLNKPTLVDFISAVKNLFGATKEEGKIMKYISLINEEYGDGEVEVVFRSDDCIVIKTKNQEAISKLGSAKWCIVYSEHYYRQYCDYTNFNTQFIIFNFNDGGNDDNSKFGITLNSKGEPLYGAHQNKNNKPLPIKDILEICNIPEGIIIADSSNKEGIEVFFTERKDSGIDDILNYLSSESKPYIDNFFNPNKELDKDVISIINDKLSEIGERDSMGKIKMGESLDISYKYKDYSISSPLNKYLSKQCKILTNESLSYLIDKVGEYGIDIFNGYNDIVSLRLIGDGSPTNDNSCILLNDPINEVIEPLSNCSKDIYEYFIKLIDNKSEMGGIKRFIFNNPIDISSSYVDYVSDELQTYIKSLKDSSPFKQYIVGKMFKLEDKKLISDIIGFKNVDIFIHELSDLIKLNIDSNRTIEEDSTYIDGFIDNLNDNYKVRINGYCNNYLEGGDFKGKRFTDLMSNDLTFRYSIIYKQLLSENIKEYNKKDENKLNRKTGIDINESIKMYIGNIHNSYSDNLSNKEYINIIVGFIKYLGESKYTYHGLGEATNELINCISFNYDNGSYDKLLPTIEYVESLLNNLKKDISIIGLMNSQTKLYDRTPSGYTLNNDFIYDVIIDKILIPSGRYTVVETKLDIPTLSDILNYIRPYTLDESKLEEFDLNLLNHILYSYGDVIIDEADVIKFDKILSDSGLIIKSGEGPEDGRYSTEWDGIIDDLIRMNSSGGLVLSYKLALSDDYEVEEVGGLKLALGIDQTMNNMFEFDTTIKIDELSFLNSYFENEPFGENVYEMFNDYNDYKWDEGFYMIPNEYIFDIIGYLIIEGDIEISDEYLSMCMDYYTKYNSIVEKHEKDNDKRSLSNSISELANSFNISNSYVEGLLSDDEDEGDDLYEHIRDNIRDSYNEAVSLSKEDEYQNQALGSLPDFMTLDFKNFIINVNVIELLTFIDENISEAIKEINDLTDNPETTDLIDIYFGYEGKISFDYDGYYDISEDLYDQVLSERLDIDIDIDRLLSKLKSDSPNTKTISESKRILKFSEYYYIAEKKNKK